MTEESQTIESCLVGVISDTHGIVPEEAIKVFKDVDLVIHAGDIDIPEALAALKSVAPVTAVRGNMDSGPWADGLSKTEVVGIGGVMIYILHDLDRLDLDPAASGFDAVISGHTHKPALVKKDGVLFINPGSAWYPRRDTAPSIALMNIDNGKIDVNFIDLE